MYEKPSFGRKMSDLKKNPTNPEMDLFEISQKKKREEEEQKERELLSKFSAPSKPEIQMPTKETVPPVLSIVTEQAEVSSVPDVSKEKEEYSIFRDQEALDALYVRAEKRVLLGAPDLNDFRKMYGNDIVDNDLKYIEEKEASFEYNEWAKYNKKISTITEALLTDCIARYDWFGKDTVTVYQSSIYDDYRNGADLFFRFNVDSATRDDNTRNFFGAGIDVVLGGSTKWLQKKVDMTYSHNKEGHLGKIKYHLDDNGEPAERLYIPHFIIAIPEADAEELMLLWKENKTEELRKHPFRNSFVLQMYTQAEEWVNEVEKSKQKASTEEQRNKQEEVIESYERAFSLTNTMIVDKVPGMRTAFMDIDNNEICNKLKYLIETSEAREEEKKSKNANQSYKAAA